MPVSPGQILSNRYRITKILSAKGGFGLVYLGERIGTSQKVAIKQNIETTAEARDQFRREAEMLRPLSHPNLVRVEDYFEDASGAQFLVMEFIPGDDLWDLGQSRKTPVPEAQVLDWGITLCQVLAYLHSRTPPIIHRDIKPHNVKIQPDGRLVLVDFGIAKIFKPGQKTQKGARGVTPGFSPLEQYGAGTNERTDIYALAATLYFLLTLQLPEEVMERVAKRSVLELRTFNSALSQATIQAITKGMEIKQENRFASASEFVAALSKGREGLVVAPSAPTCPACRTPIRPSAAFCPVCGAVMKPGVVIPRVPCPFCGQLTRVGGKFCQHCGKTLPALAAPSAPPIVPTPGVACTACGRMNRGGAKICARCGKPLMAPGAPASLPRPPAPAFPPPPLARGECPSCHNLNALNETFCRSCGLELMPQPSAPPAAPMPVPAPVAPALPSRKPAAPPPPPLAQITAAPDQAMVAWVLFGVGLITIVFSAWLWQNGILDPRVALPLAGLGVFSAMAGRDVGDLFAAVRVVLPGWLCGDANRGRRWGMIAATLWTIIGCAFAWMILPLTLVGVMGYLLGILARQDFVEAVGGKYTRPGWVTVLAWLLISTVVGVVPGWLLLRGSANGWRTARLAVLALGVAGIGLVWWTYMNQVQGSATVSALTWTLLSSGGCGAISALLFSRYLGSPEVRKHFGV